MLSGTFIQGAYPLNLAMEFRIMKKSKAYLCPASLGDQEHIFYIEVLGETNTPDNKQFSRIVAEKWMALGGIPHWQKQWTFLDQNGSMIEYLGQAYGQNLTEFKNVRTAMGVDPNDLFVNTVFRRLLDYGSS